MIKSEVVIRAFRASEDQESSLKFAEGHKKVLSAHGVTKVTSSNYDWIHDPSVFVILVESLDDGRALGGARVHASLGTGNLPIEEATQELDPTILSLVREKSRNGTGELCGLWNSLEVAGMGIGSFFAAKAAISIADQIGLSSMYALCAPYTVRWIKIIGCRVLEEVGNKGTFYYPKIDLLATAAFLEDTNKLEYAKKYEAERILFLRKNRKIQLDENPPGRKFQVRINYELDIRGADKNEFKING